MNKWVIRESFVNTKVATFVAIELAGKIIARNDAENTAINVHIHANVQIFPLIVTTSVRFWNFVSL